MKFLINRLKDEKHELIVIHFSRLFFAGLIVFELLNYFKVLRFNTQFTWLGLVITSIACLILLEITAHKYRRKKRSLSALVNLADCSVRLKHGRFRRFFPFIQQGMLVGPVCSFFRERGCLLYFIYSYQRFLD